MPVWWTYLESLFYGSHFLLASGGYNLLLLTAIVSAFLGAFMGNRLLKKVTMRTIQIIVATMLFGIAGALGTGII